jgi:hypothetical protein
VLNEIKIMFKVLTLLWILRPSKSAINISAHGHCKEKDKSWQGKRNPGSITRAEKSKDKSKSTLDIV